MDILIKFLTIIIIVLFPLGQVFRVTTGSGVAINPLDIGVSVAAIVSLVIVISKKKFPSTFVPLFLFTGIGFAGLCIYATNLTSAEFFVSLLYLLRFVAYAMVGVSIYFLKKEKKKFLMKILFLSGGIVLFAGYIQYFLYQSLWGVLYEGWDPHLYRMFSTFLDPNFTGVFYVLYFLLILDTWWHTKEIGYKWMLSAVGVLGFFAVVLSFSRGAYVDFGISVVIYLFLQGYKKIAVTIPVLIIVVSIFIAYFLPYGEEKHLFRTASTQARLISAENALTIFVKNPLLGVGFNSYRYAQHRYHLLSGFNWEDTHSGAGANNSYVFVLATTGILGGIVYAWFWIGILKGSLRQLQEKKPYSLFLFSSWIAILVSGSFENTLFYPSLMLWIFILAGFTG